LRVFSSIIKKGADRVMGLYEKIVNYESTVYPGVTEDIVFQYLKENRT